MSHMALSVRQPFANQIIRGEKVVENRSWTTDYRGQLLIHASGKHYSLPTGCIVGSVNLVEILKRPNFYQGPNQTIGFVQKALGREIDFESFCETWDLMSDYWWVLDQPVVFETPLKVKGQLRLWEYDGELPSLFGDSET